MKFLVVTKTYDKYQLKCETELNVVPAVDTYIEIGDSIYRVVAVIHRSMKPSVLVVESVNHSMFISKIKDILP